MNDKPTIKAKITFLSEEKGGRHNLNFDKPEMYRPHLTIQDPSNREKMIKEGTVEDYLGVIFLNGPSKVNPDEENIFELSLAYWPEIQYKKLVENTFFAIREGDRIVGFGKVIAKNDR